MTERYVGTKIVLAWAQEKEGQAGYAVKYDDGYISWSPKDKFEAAYLALGHEVEQLQPHAQRVVAERAVLDKNLTGLNKFLEHQANGGLVVDLSQEHKDLLNKQQDLMTQLSDVLGQRIQLFYNEIKADNGAEGDEQLSDLGLPPVDGEEPADDGDDAGREYQNEWVADATHNSLSTEMPGSVDDMIAEAKTTNHGDTEVREEDRRHTPIGPVVMISLGDESTNLLDQAAKQLGGNFDMTAAIGSIRFIEALSADQSTTHVEVVGTIENSKFAKRGVSIQGKVGDSEFMVDIDRERGDVEVVAATDLTGITLKLEIELENPNRRPQQ